MPEAESKYMRLLATIRRLLRLSEQQNAFNSAAAAPTMLALVLALTSKYYGYEIICYASGPCTLPLPLETEGQ
jgi:hypothetical protein